MNENMECKESNDPMIIEAKDILSNRCSLVNEADIESSGIFPTTSKQNVSFETDGEVTQSAFTSNSTILFNSISRNEPLPNVSTEFQINVVNHTKNAISIGTQTIDFENTPLYYDSCIEFPNSSLISSRKQFPCLYCDKVYLSKSSRSRHKVVMHVDAPKPIIYKKNKKVIEEPDSNNNTKETQTYFSIDYNCKFCSRFFKSETLFRYHIQNKHDHGSSVEVKNTKENVNKFVSILKFDENGEVSMEENKYEYEFVDGLFSLKLPSQQEKENLVEPLDSESSDLEEECLRDCCPFPHKYFMSVGVQFGCHCTDGGGCDSCKDPNPISSTLCGGTAPKRTIYNSVNVQTCFNAHNAVCLTRCDKACIRRRRKNLWQTKRAFDEPDPVRGSSKCMECNQHFCQIMQLRIHLELTHNIQATECHELTFPTVQAFKQWKIETERKSLNSYGMRFGAKQSNNFTRWYFICHRSGSYKQRVTTRISNTKGTMKMEINCTSAINAMVFPNCIKVKYYPVHYGHGDTTYVQLSLQEHMAIQENVSEGISLENLLDGLQDEQYSNEYFRQQTIMNKDFRCMRTIFITEEFHPGLNEFESIDQWVNQLSEMEESPILYFNRTVAKESEFQLIIMSQFQKHILLASEKQVICVDNVKRTGKTHLLMMAMYIIDEYNIGFPAAFCFCSKINKEIVSLFYSAILEAVGPLHCDYFMSDSSKFFYEAWVEVMGGTPKWLWSLWYIDHRLLHQLSKVKDINKRDELAKNFQKTEHCQNENLFHSMVKNFIESIPQDLPMVRNYIQQTLGNDLDKWGMCYRKDISLAAGIQLRILYKSLWTAFQYGRKTRKDKFIFAIMKWVKFKILDRLVFMVEKDQIALALNSIKEFHQIGLEIDTRSVSSVSDKIWVIESSDSETVYVTQETLQCPEHCNLKCNDCDVCVHMYSCSCAECLINANFCQHIHAVVFKFITPHYSPPASPTLELESECTLPSSKHILETVLERSHNIYQKLKSNQLSLNSEALESLSENLLKFYDNIDNQVRTGSSYSSTSAVTSSPNNCLLSLTDRPKPRKRKRPYSGKNDSNIKTNSVTPGTSAKKSDINSSVTDEVGETSRALAELMSMIANNNNNAVI